MISQCANPGIDDVVETVEEGPETRQAYRLPLLIKAVGGGSKVRHVG